MFRSYYTGRRQWLKQVVGLSAGAFLTGVRQLSVAAEQTSQMAADAACKEIWRRFIDQRFHVLLHYAGLKGEVFLPTGEECQLSQPNGMSWSTPIEDGPFFGGLFLDGLCLRWRVRKDEASAAEARKIAGGLLKLAEFSPTPGFVPRGIAEDERSFYPASSEDQVFPWIFGLWSYLHTDLPDEQEKERIRAKLKETVLAIESHLWRVPCSDPAFGYRGDFTRPNAHDAARLLFLLRAMHQLTGDDRWLHSYRQRLAEKVGREQKTRLQICAEGLHYTPPGSHETFIWTHSMSQAALRAVADAETEPETANALRQGLKASAEHVAEHLKRAVDYSRSNEEHFDVDWRFLKESWKPQVNCEEAISLARSQLPLWAKHNPRSPYEDDTMREPLFAAWIIRLANDKELHAKYDARIQELLSTYDWEGLYTANFFIAVNVHYEGEGARVSTL